MQVFGLNVRKLAGKAGKYMKTAKVSNYSGAVLLTVLGIVMIVKPALVMNFICYAIAAVLIILGIVKLVSYAARDIKNAVYGHDFALGVMLIICGVMFVLKADIIQNLVPMIMGLVIVANGIMKLQHAINLMRFKSGSSTFVLIISLVCIAIGAVLLFLPSEVNKLVLIIIGVGFVASGITDIATYIIMSGKLKKRDAEANKPSENTDTCETVENAQVVEISAAKESYDAAKTDNV